MQKMMAAAAAVLLMAAGAAAQDAGKKYGEGVTLKDAVSVANLYAAPETFVGKKIRVDGVATAVCEEMGCWIAVASAQDKDLVVRLKVDHSQNIVFPISARGKQVSLEGTFEKIASTDAEGQEAAQENSSSNAKAAAFGKAYQIKGTGAIVRD